MADAAKEALAGLAIDAMSTTGDGLAVAWAVLAGAEAICHELAAIRARIDGAWCPSCEEQADSEAVGNG